MASMLARASRPYSGNCLPMEAKFMGVRNWLGMKIEKIPPTTMRMMKRVRLLDSLVFTRASSCGSPASTLDQRKGAPALDPLLDVRDADAQHDDQPDKELLPVR